MVGSELAITGTEGLVLVNLPEKIIIDECLGCFKVEGVGVSVTDLVAGVTKNIKESLEDAGELNHVEVA